MPQFVNEDDSRLMTAVPALQQNRHRQVLAEVVRAYIETGEPVSSRTIVRMHAEPLSSATIRNIMADLEDEGLSVPAAHFRGTRAHGIGVPLLRRANRRASYAARRGSRNGFAANWTRQPRPKE